MIIPRKKEVRKKEKKLVNNEKCIKPSVQVYETEFLPGFRKHYLQ